jgi:hypothetical protein
MSRPARAKRKQRGPRPDKRERSSEPQQSAKPDTSSRLLVRVRAETPGLVARFDDQEVFSALELDFFRRGDELSVAEPAAQLQALDFEPEQRTGQLKPRSL